MSEKSPGVTRTPATWCPECQCKLEAASDLDTHKAIPVPGDLSLCIHCGTVLIFDQFLTPVRPPDGLVESRCLLDTKLWDDITRKQHLIRSEEAQAIRAKHPPRRRPRPETRHEP
jgi:hypothetical protein